MNILQSIILTGTLASFFTFLILYVEIISTSFVTKKSSENKNHIILIHVFRRLSISVIMSGLVLINLILNIFILYFFIDPIPENYLEWPLRILYALNSVMFSVSELFAHSLRALLVNLDIEETKYTILFFFGIIHNLFFLKFYFSSSSKKYFSSILRFLVSVFIVVGKKIAHSSFFPERWLNKLKKNHKRTDHSSLDTFFTSGEPYLKEINVWMDTMVLLLTSIGLILTSNILSPFMTKTQTIWFIVIFLGVINAKIISNHEKID